MKYWIYKNGLQRGPFTIEELSEMELTPDTPVWYEGLDNWITAAESPGLAPLLTVRHNNGNDAPTDVAYTEVGGSDTDSDNGYDPVSRPTADTAAERRHTDYVGGIMQGKPNPPAESVAECPPTYLFWSIISTICCCVPLGIVAIIYSGKVKPKWQAGDINGARKASETAQLLIILSVTIGLLTAPLSLLL